MQFIVNFPMKNGDVLSLLRYHGYRHKSMDWFTGKSTPETI